MMRNLTRYLVSSAAILLLASPAFAQGISGQALETSLNELAQAQAQDYVQARDALLARDGVQEALAQRQPAWTQQSWRADAMAAVVQGRLTDAASFEAASSLQGVRAGRYLAFRRPGPHVFRELRPKATKVAPAVIELLLKTRAAYPYVGDFPPAMDAEIKADWQAKEKAALHEGLLLTLGTSKHPASVFVLTSELEQTSYSAAARSAAAVGLGMTNDPAALAALEPMARSANADLGLRSSCLSGVALIPADEAMDLLIDLSDADAPRTVRKAAVAGLGTLGSSWGWQARGQLEQSKALRKRAAERLVAVLASQSSDSEIVTFAIQGIVAVDHPAAAQGLAELAGSDNDDVQAAVRKAQVRLEIANRRKAR